MDNQDIRTLRILEELEENHAPSQRYLSEKLNISLGLVNSFLKRLAQKGYFKATTIPKNRVKYMLTPKGALEKTRLTYEYIQHSFQFYRDARKKLRGLLKELDKAGTNSIIFYGVSDLAEIAYISLQETAIKLYAVIDEENQSQKFLKHEVESLEKLDHLRGKKVLITKIDADDKHVDTLLQFGVERKNILTFQQ